MLHGMNLRSERSKRCFTDLDCNIVYYNTQGEQYQTTKRSKSNDKMEQKPLRINETLVWHITWPRKCIFAVLGSQPIKRQTKFIDIMKRLSRLVQMKHNNKMLTKIRMVLITLRKRITSSTNTRLSSRAVNYRAWYVLKRILEIIVSIQFGSSASFKITVPGSRGKSTRDIRTIIRSIVNRKYHFSVHVKRNEPSTIQNNTQIVIFIGTNVSVQQLETSISIYL